MAESECEYLADCSFFGEHMGKLQATAASIKRTFCCGKYTKCARYIVMQRLGKAPASLFPFQTDRAEKILREADRLVARKQREARSEPI